MEDTESEDAEEEPEYSDEHDSNDDDERDAASLIELAECARMALRASELAENAAVEAWALRNEVRARMRARDHRRLAARRESETAVREGFPLVPGPPEWVGSWISSQLGMQVAAGSSDTPSHSVAL